MSSLANFSKQTGRLAPHVKQVSSSYFSTSVPCASVSATKAKLSTRLAEKLRGKTPNWNELSRHPFQEVDQLRPWPKGVNPVTGEVGGPTGPEPTRYGDWERRGRVSDF